MTEESAALDFAAVWSQTLASDPVLRSGGFADQRARGLTEQYVCWIRIDDTAVLDALRPLRSELGSIPGVHLDIEETLHITLKVVGFGPSESGQNTNEISAAELAALSNELDAIGDEFAPFEVSIRGLNAFPSVVFAEPHADGGFRHLHDEIRALDGIPPFQYEGDDYVPHVSLAHFDTVDGYEQALSWVSDHRKIQPLTTTVRGFEFASLPLSEYAPDDIECIRRIELTQ